MNKRRMVGKLAGWLALAVLCGGPAEAQFSIFAIGDASGEAQFTDAMDAAGAVPIGQETFVGSTIGPEEEVSLPGSLLAPGVANGPFPHGTAAGLGLYYQTNVLGGNPDTWSPGGPLYASGAAVGEIGFVRVGAEKESDSLDLIVDPAAFRGLVRGLSLQAVVQGGDALEVRLFDDQHNVLALESFDASETGTLLIGVAASPESTFFRVNLWAPNGWTDAGNITVYAVPEPAASAAIAGMFILFLLWIRRRAIGRDTVG